MNDKLKYDHFKNTKELLEHIAVWYRDDDVYFSRWFGLNDLNNLRIYINQLQSSWNSLREWLEKQKHDAEICKEWNSKNNFNDIDYERDIKRFDFVLDKMNELESGEKN